MAGDTLSGGCLCGAVCYEMRGPFRPVHVCHCSQCRKWSGHVLAATAVMTDRLTVTGEDNVSWYPSSPGVARGFCRRCGSSLFWRAGDGQLTSVMAGTIEPPTGLGIGAHIFTADASDYEVIADDAPHQPQGMPEAWAPVTGA